MEGEVMSPSQCAAMHFIESYRIRRDALERYKADFYPPLSVVLVSNPSFKGYGIVMPSSGSCAADDLRVLVESGNIWHYSLETIVHREQRVTSWPTWIRKAVLRDKLVNLQRKPQEGQPSA